METCPPSAIRPLIQGEEELIYPVSRGGTHGNVSTAAGKTVEASSSSGTPGYPREGNKDEE
eukprot:6835710-Karenia_brevis.AAC.1